MADLEKENGEEQEEESANSETVRVCDLPSELEEKLKNAWENFAEAFPGAMRTSNTVKRPLFENIIDLIRFYPNENYSTRLPDTWLQHSTIFGHLGDIANVGLIEVERIDSAVMVRLTEEAFTKGYICNARDAVREKKRVKQEEDMRRWRENQEQQAAKTEAEAQRLRWHDHNKLVAAIFKLFGVVVTIVDSKTANDSQMEIFSKNLRIVSWLTRSSGGLPIEEGVRAFLDRLKENEKFYSEAKRADAIPPDDENELGTEDKQKREPEGSLDQRPSSS